MKLANDLAAVCCVTLGLVAGASGYNLALHWQGSGGAGVGNYGVASNWQEGVIPGLSDLAAFNNTANRDWAITFTDNVTNDTFSIVVPSANCETSFNLNQRTYWVTNSLNIWTGSCGRVTISNGVLKVKTAGFTPSPDGAATNLALNVRNASLELESAMFSAAYATFDSGSLWVSNRLNIGGVNRGKTTLRLTNGVRCGVTNELNVGFESGATGEIVNVDGVLRHSGVNTCAIGVSGYGTMTLIGGTTRVDRAVTLGSALLSIGNLNVLGGSNTFSTVSNDRLNVGDSGKGYLLGGGGTNNIIGLVLGNSPGGYGEATITGGVWRVAEHMWAGMSGRGVFTISGGQMFFTGGGPVMSIGRNAGATGEVTVAGGLVDMGSNSSVWLGRADTGSGTLGRLVLRGGGILRTKAIFEYSATATSQILFDGGTLQAAVSGALIYSVDDVRLTANGMVVDTAGYNVSIAAVLRDAAGEAGSITEKGTGTLTLATDRTATGPMSVLSGGTLVASNGLAVAAGTSRIDGTLTLTTANRLTVGAGAALAGTGAVTRVTFQDGAVLARAKSDNAITPINISDCAANDRLVIALTGYSFADLRTSIPLIRAPTAFINTPKITVMLNGQASSQLTTKFVDVGGQQVLYVSYSAGMLIKVL